MAVLRKGAGPHAAPLACDCRLRRVAVEFRVKLYLICQAVPE